MAEIAKPIYFKLYVKSLRNVSNFCGKCGMCSFLTLRKLKFLFMEIKETILP